MGEEAYVGVKGLGSGERAVREGGGSWAENRKPSRQGSVLGNETWWALDLSWGGIVGEGWTGVEGMGGGEQVGARVWGTWPKSEKRAAGARFSLMNCGGHRI